MNKNMRKFADIVIDLNKVTMLKKSSVLLEDGNWHDIGDEAADAMRLAFTPLSDREPQSTPRDMPKE